MTKAERKPIAKPKSLKDQISPLRTSPQFLTAPKQIASPQHLCRTRAWVRLALVGVLGKILITMRYN